MKTEKYKENVNSDKLENKKWKKAFEFAKKAHEGQKRAEGVPYFEHIKGVMEILLNEAEIVDDDVLTVAALHDVIEDTEYSYEDIKQDFGENIAEQVNLLTRFPGQHFSEYAKGIFENSKYPHLRDIKLADRLHNLRTLPATKDPARIARKVKQTENFILPYENDCLPLLINKIKAQINYLKTCEKIHEKTL